MSEVFYKLSGLATDAVPQRPNPNINENVIKPKFPIERLVDGFSVEDYKSAFFLLMDYVDEIRPENFIYLTNQNLPDLKAKFIMICQEYCKDETVLIELFGTLKMFKKLKLIGTCFHVHESQSNQFKHIKKFWKTLYMLCEELTDGDVKILKQNVPENFRNHIQTAEDWLCWALNEKKFYRTDLSGLETIFKEYPNCLNILRSFKELEFYPMKVPSSSSSCGLALILNYDTFNENTGLNQRHNSEKDVDALKELWKNFGFEIKYCLNLSCSETFKEFKDCALADHSRFDAFVCCILSHGISDSVYSSDGKKMKISDLIRPIMNDCFTLNNKPKLFFIQACQGTNIHQGAGKPIYRLETLETAEPIESCESISPPINCDTLISKSTIEGYVSFRDDKGSWFFQTFCKIMEQYGATYTIEEILTKVNDEISKLSANLGPSGPTNALQLSEYRSYLRKKLILNKCLK